MGTSHLPDAAFTRNPIVSANEWSSASVITASQSAANFPATELLVPQPTRIWRASDLTAAIEINCDRGSAKPASVVFLGYTNATSEATYRVRAAASVALLDTAPVYDTANNYGTHLRTKSGGVAIPSDASLQLPASPNDDFTIDFWFRPKSIVPTNIVNVSGGTVDAEVRLISGLIQFRSTPGPIGFISSINPLVAGTWYHVCCTYEADGVRSELWIDGVSQGTSVPSGTMTDGDQLNINFSGGTADFDIDALRYWKRSFDLAFVLTVKDIQATGPFTDLLGAWNCDDQRGLVLSDIAGNDNSGVIDSACRFAFPDLVWPSSDLVHLSRVSLFDYLPGGWTAQFVQIDILDEDNSDNEFVGGIVAIGDAWTLPRGRRYGGSPLGINDQSTVNRTSGGQTTIKRSGVQRVFRIVVPDDVALDAEKRFNRIARVNGGSKPVVMCLDPTQDAELEGRIAYGLLDRRWAIRHSNKGLHDVPINFVEML